ncbi:MAG: NlpC/P60 family protein [Coprobacillaceae bacterium]
MKKVIIIAIITFFPLFIILAIGGQDNNSTTTTDGGTSIDGLPFCIKEEMVIASIEVREEYGYPVSVTLAQIIQESTGSYKEGLSTLAYEYKNLFGIKFNSNYADKSINLGTQEEVNGGNVSTSADFCWWDTWTDCIKARAKLLQNSYGVDGITDANLFADQLAKWATDSNYVTTLKNHMETYDLYKYDTMTVEEFKEENKDLVVSGDSELGNAIANSAMSKKGSPYVWGANGPNSFDCSGLVWWACKENGINFTRTTAEGLSTMGQEVSINDLQAGDIITFRTIPSYVSHVGIYIGNGKMVHAPTFDVPVSVDTVIGNRYWEGILVNCRRLY